MLKATSTLFLPREPSALRECL